MFRRNEPSLPTTMHGVNNSNKNGLLSKVQSAFAQEKAGDGSARSIHPTPPIVKWWKRQSRAVQRLYQVAMFGVVLTYVGYRTIRYQNAYVHLTCHSTECHIKAQSVGWRKAVELTVGREQVVASGPVKTNRQGQFVTDENVQIEEYAKYSANAKQQKNKKKYSSSYRGPASDGLYVTYMIVLRDSWKALKDRPVDASAPEVPPRSLTSLLPFLQDIGGDRAGDYRLIFRQQGMAQSRRRVRSMIQKLTGYVKRRRQRLIIKENAAPSWQGIVCVVVGVLAAVLCLLLGQLWAEEDEIRANQKASATLRRQRLQQQQYTNSPTKKNRVYSGAYGGGSMQQQHGTMASSYASTTGSPRPRRQQVTSNRY